MSGTHDWSLFIGLREDDFVRALTQAAKDLGLTVSTDPEASLPPNARPLCWKECGGGICSPNPGVPGRIGRLLPGRISEICNCTWLWASTFEGSVWYYYLKNGEKTIDAYHVSKGFCRANEWSPTLAASSSPEDHADKLSSVCKVPPSSIQEYFRDWGYAEADDEYSFSIRGTKAYPTDKYNYGDGYQLFDLLKRLGFEDSGRRMGYYVEHTG
jgi:hypothetical protein